VTALLVFTAGDAHVRPLYQHMFVPSVGPSFAFIVLPWRCAKIPQFQLLLLLPLLQVTRTCVHCTSTCSFHQLAHVRSISWPQPCLHWAAHPLLLLLPQVTHMCGRCTSTCSFHQ
jgi:hypothetical protein